ncbi:hypothetical protein [Pandoraea sp. NPDC087047]|uniref:hypothetical protein n=1 Tax=Pandoraea sp. NPDC087047 TaxID=3364390 RepID=UPI00381C075C
MSHDLITSLRRNLRHWRNGVLWALLFAVMAPAHALTGVEYLVNQRDELNFGIALAQRLNARFADTSACPGGEAPYLCNGVIIRETGYSPDFHAWNPSPSSVTRNGVSASYMRADAGVTAIAHQGGEGLIFAPFGAPAQLPLTARCIYPSDAGTDGRADKCGIRTIPLSAPCAQLGITTLEAWRANYDQTKNPYQCALGVDTAAFMLSLAARATFPLPHTRLEQWNEFIIAPWPQDVPAQIPLEAAMYTPESASYRTGAQAIQTDYFNQTGKFLPVIKVDIKGNPQAPFSYSAADQVIVPDESIAAIAPRVLEATGEVGHRLLLNDFYTRDFVTVEVPDYPGMSIGQTVGARWRGPSVTYDTPIKTVTSIGPMTFEIPRVEVVDAIGTTVPVTFSVKRGNNPIENSAPLNLQIEAQALVLPAPTINAERTEVTVVFPNATSNHAVKVRWSGVVERDTVSQYVDPGHPNVFVIPASWVSENAGKTVAVNYAVGTRSGARYQFSKILRVRF